jgi:hypothetical protein
VTGCGRAGLDGLPAKTICTNQEILAPLTALIGAVESSRLHAYIVLCLLTGPVAVVGAMTAHQARQAQEAW